MHLHSKSSDENSQKAYRTLYESVKYANPKYMFRNPELATPFSKFHLVRIMFSIIRWWLGL